VACVDALFQTLLNRTPNASEESIGVQDLARLGPIGFARQTLTSTEMRERAVDASYAGLLRRPADAAERTFWTQSLASGQLSFRDLEVQFLSSQEYFAAS